MSQSPQHGRPGEPDDGPVAAKDFAVASPEPHEKPWPLATDIPPREAGSSPPPTSSRAASPSERMGTLSPTATDRVFPIRRYEFLNRIRFLFHYGVIEFQAALIRPQCFVRRSHTYT